MAVRTGSHHLARLAEAALERRGDYPALLFEGVWHSSAALHEWAGRVAGGLAALGVRPGDRVLVIARNCPEVLLAYQAAWRIGATVVPAIFMLSAAEVEHVLRDSEVRVAIAEADLVATVRAAATRAGGGATVVAIGDARGQQAGVVPSTASAGADQDGVVPFAALADADSAPIASHADEDLAALVYTGGTTGRAKGVMLTHENLWHAGRSRCEVGFAAGVDRTLVTLPLSHTFGLLVTIADLHWPGRRITAVLRWFDADAFLRVAAEAAITDATVVPAMLQALLAQPLERHELGALRSVVSGSAPLPPKVAAAFRARLPWVELREGYGLTEVSALVAATPPGGVRPGSVGRPAPGTEVRIVDDGGVALGAGEAGEICVRSPFVMAGYWRDADATAAALRNGWLHTGDVGYLDADGYLFIVDRKKDLIIRGGFNVHPRDVEEALLAHDGIAEVAVVGRPDEARGEEVVAFVVPRAGAELEPAVLVAWARERIGGYKYPREIHLAVALPRTSIGKVDRKRLRAHLVAHGR